MNWIEKWIAMPSPGHIVVSEYLLLIALFVLFAYSGFVIGSAVWSVFFRVVACLWPHERFAAISRQIIRLAAPSIWPLLFFCLIPLIALPLLYGQVMYPGTKTTSPEQTTGMLLMALPMVAAGLALLLAYRAASSKSGSGGLLTVLPGLAAVGLLLGGFHFVTGAVTISLDPERWPFIKSVLERLLFSWNEIARFSHFIALSFALAGSALLFRHSRERDETFRDDDDYTRFARNFAGGLTLISCLALPVLNFWNTITLQYQAVSPAYYAAVGVGTFVLAAAAIGVLKALLDEECRQTSFPLAAVLLFALIFTLADATARSAALSDERSALMASAEAAELAAASAKEAKYGKHGAESGGGGGASDASRGDQIAQTKGCMACHSVDGAKRVGPTWKGLYGHDVTVVTGGQERTVTADDAYLAKSISEPNADVVKGYPAVMPAQPMSESDIRALVEYIKSVQ